MFKKCNFLMLNLLLAVSALAEWTNDYMKREHSLIKPYQGKGMMVPYWDFQGATLVTSNYVRVTADSPSKTGSLWNSVPCNVVSWEMQIHFKIHGHAKDLFGDGMAFWYTKDRMNPGPVFGSQDYFYGLAVFIDTYSNHNGEHNHQHPYISAMVNNGTLHYDHDRDGTHTALAGCEAKLRNVYYDTNIAIRYEKDTLTVMTDVDNKGEFKECFKVPGVKLPTGYYFGVSAATGELSDNHDILSMRLLELDSSDVISGEDRSKIMPFATVFEPPRERVDDEKPAWSGTKTFFVMLFVALLLIAIAIAGISYYKDRQEHSKKHFY
ncbi:vesicular integral-membrane protein VIP36 [Cimex lectularius]|uniref:L-type lectin-like domain-containing protein n=1 Tax=Cimex lectularius TaxID=79782 RepID=A0A8I6RAK1_CIMLE|nr:vesicular integral-membrane protein VIP36 [Cimex lectularius]